MPIDYQQIYTRIKTIGQNAQGWRKQKEERQSQTQTLLSTYAFELDYLRNKVEAAKAADPNIRCALPLNEPLTFSGAAPDSVKEATLIAADGSQSIAGRHDPIQFCVINVGALTMRPNSGQAPSLFVESELFYGDEIEENGLTTDGGVALRRDLSERSVIEKLGKDFSGPVISFTDGTLEIFRSKDVESANSYKQTVDSYIGVLSRLQSRCIVTAGYIDKPGSNLVVRLLELAQATIPDDLEKLRNSPPLKHVTDRWLFGFQNHSFQLLPTGHRSAIFKLQSSADKNYRGVLELHFFYLNVGTDGHPWPVRVEIPKWVVDDHDSLDLLHAVLVDQCSMMGHRPYPYLLHRAHETAVVKMEEKQQIEQMLALELRRNNEELDEISNKQSAKNQTGRSRFG